MTDQAHLHDPALLERWFQTLARTIALDFDGTLHPYTEGWVGSVPADEPPIDGALEFATVLKGDGYRLVVFSCRADHPEGLQGIEVWLKKYGFDVLIDEVTHLKPPAIAYVDDRAVPFRGSWRNVLDGIDQLAGGPAHGAGRVAPAVTPEWPAPSPNDISALIVIDDDEEFDPAEGCPNCGRVLGQVFSPGIDFTKPPDMWACDNCGFTHPIVAHRTPTAWMAITGIRVVDPDGWRNPPNAREWTTPITEAEFRERASRSTTDYSKQKEN